MSDNKLTQLRQFQTDLVTKLMEAKVDLDIIKLHKCDQEFEEGNETATLRGILVLEEAEELDEVLFCGTKEEMLKELCDVLYVAYGVAAIYGLPLDAAFNRVHDNNMLKLATGTIRHDGKLIKAANHPKVNLKDLV